jgi:hypothetical protein
LGLGGSVPLITLIVYLVLIGLLMYLINNFLPIDAKFKQLINVIVFVCVILWLVSLFLPVGPWIGRHP